ncbi:RusA family crossover junction endodeoxyribonuclease [Mesorhizobium sp. Z1-4]|uniref:RusA family crossover junction endodeoxyribonuclease n=1 Tax=Mesorhizobium sp. Z1-4 TaxID=2448478 RepID=UPI000FDC1D00|nr:RusA family crossover junction endodeoxyribonuclease [Mesorhizobium sp. Z1-4]
MTSAIRYDLPFPPAANNLFFNTGKGRAKSVRYKQWQKDAGNLINAQGRKRITGPVSIYIGAVKPDKRKRDISNLIKPVEDILVAMGVIEDDSLVERVNAEWMPSGPPCVVIVQEHFAEMAA